MNNFFGFQGGSTNNGNMNSGSGKPGGFMGKVSSALGQLNQAVKDVTVNEAGLSATELQSRGLQALNSGNYEKARRMFVAGAYKRDAVSAMQLHRMYAEGVGVGKDDAQAWFWARLSGEYGDGRGDFITGLCYQNGTGVVQDRPKAWKYYERAVRRGCSDAKSYLDKLTTELVEIFYSPQSEEAAFDKDIMKAMKGGAEAYYKYCAKLASFDSEAGGKSLLGLCYKNRNGTEVDDIAAVYWFKRAIECGHSGAKKYLASMYEWGRGVLVDLPEAIRLAEAAEKDGMKEASAYAARLRKTLKLSDAELNQKITDLGTVGSDSPNNEEPRLVAYYSMHLAQKGDALACRRVATAYHYQEGVKRDYNEALFYHGKTILLYKAQNDMDSAGITFLLISKMYALGLGVEKNSATAEQYFRLAKKYYEYAGKYSSVTELMNAKMEEARKKGAYALAEAYEAGYDCVPDVAQAFKYYELCANANYIPGFNALIRIYFEGYCVPKDDGKAMEYLKRCVNGLPSCNNPNLWRTIHQSKVCGLVLRAYNTIFGEMSDVLTVEMAIELCKLRYRSKNLAMAEMCREAARYKGASNVNQIWKELEAEALEKEKKEAEKAEAEARRKAEEEAREKAERDAQERAARERQVQEICSQAMQEFPVTEIQVDDEVAEMLRKDHEEFKEKMSMPENQNAQMEPEKKPVENGGYFDAQMQEIRRLTNEKKFEELAELGYRYYDEDGESYNERLGILCLKTAMLHGEINAFYSVGMAFAAGSGVPQDLVLAEKILQRIAEIDSAQIDKNLITEMLNDVRAEWEEGVTREEMEGRAQEYREIADGLEESYYPEEAWKLYEYYRMSTYEKSLRGQRPKIKLKDKYFSQRVDWDQVLAMPWEMFCQSADTSKDIEVNSLSTAASEQDGIPDDLEKYFEGMIGMESVKEQLDKIYQAVKMQLLREQILRERGEEIQESEKGYNFILLGNPGTGKTTVARIIAQILYDIKIRTSDAFIEIERSGVVSDHVGGTENRMREILRKVEGGTLFIDEAYSLYKEDSDTDFGQEAIDVLMKDMEDHRNSYSVIMAGYREPMMNMIKNANSGFSSRFSYYIELPDYSDEALIEIAHKHIEKQKFVVGEGVDVAIKKCIAHDKLDHTFGNARYVRELVHRAIENQSQRLSKQGNYESEELFLLKAEDFWQGTWEEEGVDKYLAELNRLTGLQSVKEEVNSLINLITVQKEMERRGLESSMDFGTLHMAFKGNPGTGKTTVARIIGKLYANLGVLKRGDVFVECSRADLVGKFQGHTATNVKKVVESALGGILFIDEAYSLVQGEGDSFGREAVDTLVAEMENNRKNLVVIFAGYTKDLNEFFKNNQGLKSRVPKELIFEDYDLNELYEICRSMINTKKLKVTESAEEALRASLLRNSLKENFGNARGVRNLVDATYRKQNVRIAQMMKEGKKISDDLLVTIEAEDVE